MEGGRRQVGSFDDRGVRWLRWRIKGRRWRVLEAGSGDSGRGQLGFRLEIVGIIMGKVYCCKRELEKVVVMVVIYYLKGLWIVGMEGGKGCLEDSRVK